MKNTSYPEIVGVGMGELVGLRDWLCVIWTQCYNITLPSTVVNCSLKQTTLFALGHLLLLLVLPAFPDFLLFYLFLRLSWLGLGHVCLPACLFCVTQAQSHFHKSEQSAKKTSPKRIKEKWAKKKEGKI